jgi:chromate transport protein ChrA
MINTTKFILPGIIFLFTLASGVWLSNAGKPYNNAIFTLHKLIALGAVVLAAIQMVKGFKTTGITPVTIGLSIITILAVIALFATGALMSLDKELYKVWLIIHQIAPAVISITSAAIIYLLTKGQS